LKNVPSSQTNIIARILVVKYEEELRSVMELQLAFQWNYRPVTIQRFGPAQSDGS